MRQQIGTLSTDPAVMVRFHDGKTWFFGSLAAIYEMFTADEVGCPPSICTNPLPFGRTPTT